MKRDLHLASVEDTERFGARLGALLRSGDFVGLTGELGAGKTALVRGVAKAVGIPHEAQVSSPTFAIVNTYKGGRLTLLHADLYRVHDAEELYDAGFYDLIGSDDAALLVEWVELVPELPPSDWLQIRLLHAPTGRELEVIAHGDAWTARLQALVD